MAKKTIKIGDKVKSIQTGNVYTVLNILHGYYFFEGCTLPLTASEIERVPDKPQVKKKSPIKKYKPIADFQKAMIEKNKNIPKPDFKPKTPIKKVSDKRSKQLRAYKVLAEDFKKRYPECQAKLEGCTIIATELHHAGGKENEILLDTTKFRHLCHNCHTKVTENSKEAIENGHSISRHKKNL